MKALFELLPLLLWTALWAAGGWLITGAVFRLRRGETALAGLAIGLILEIWLANLLAHVLPIVAASWLTAALLLLAGAACWIVLRPRAAFRLSGGQWALLGALFLLFTG